MEENDYAAQKAAARANQAFYRAIEKADLSAMREIWLDSERVRCIHPGWGLLVGAQQVMASWEAIFRSPERLRFEVADLAVEVHGGRAQATALERIHASADGRSSTSEAVATNLYELHEGSWRMTLHHASPVMRPPFGG
jgi:ketosteroid isomerase-like protein